MPQLEPILSQSMQQYERILDFLQKMDVEVGTADPVALQNFSETLNALQAQAVKIDQVLFTQMDREPIKTETTQICLDKRSLLLKEILFLNERISKKALTVNALIAHEMGKLRNGRTALSGYKPQQQHQGRIVNGSS